MKQAIVLLLVVALTVMGSAKPYESYRKPSAPNQYPFYGPNFLYGSDRLSDEFLRRLFAQSVKDSAVEVPFIHLPDVSPSDVDERLWELVKPQEKPLEDKQPKPIEEDEIDAAEDIAEPLKDVPKEAPVDRDEKDNSEKPIEKEQEKPQKPDQQPKEGDKEKEAQQQKPDQPPKEEDKKHKQQKPGQPPKEDEKDKEHKQQKPGQPPKEDGERKEAQPSKGNRPGGRKPFEGLARRPGKNGGGPRADRDKPEAPSSPQPALPPRRQPEAPLVQINVNVGSPVL